jgi:hypothetical protein
MIDREKVIKGLECCAADCVDGCPYEKIEAEGWNCTTLLCRDALELLKAQEPRLLKQEELEEVGGVCYLEWFADLYLGIIIHEDVIIQKGAFTDTAVGIATEDGIGFWALGEYGKTWRCWTSRPTDEQRKKTPWEGR